MVMRRDFLGGAGLLAGLVLAPPALAAETSRVTGRAEFTTDKDGGSFLVVFLTNHGPDANDVRADSGHAVLADNVKVNGQPVWVMQEGMMSRGGPRLAWKPLPVGEEVQVGRYWTEVITEGEPSAQERMSPPVMTGTVELTLRTGPITVSVGGEKKA